MWLGWPPMRTLGSRSRALALTITVVLAVAIVGGCGGDQPAPTTTAPPGFRVISDAKVGFAIAVPSSWQRIPLSTNLDEFDRNANRIRSQNPKLASAIVLARIIAGSSGRVMAVAPDGVASVNLTADKAAEKDLDVLSRKIIAAHLENGATDPVAARPTVDGNPAVRLTFQSPVETDAGRVVTDEIQYVLLRDGSAYILTVMNADAQAADAIAASLRLR